MEWALIVFAIAFVGLSLLIGYVWGYEDASHNHHARTKRRTS